MEFSGTQTIAARIEMVWAFLLDVNKVAACAPGFQSLEVLGEEEWKAVIAVGIGPVKAKFTLDVTRPEMQEPERMVVKGRGKAPGSAVELAGEMQLTALEEGQTLGVVVSRAAARPPPVCRLSACCRRRRASSGAPSASRATS